MFILRDLPSVDELRSLTARYPGLDPDPVSSLLEFMRTAYEIFQASESMFAQHGTSCGRFAVLALLNRNPDGVRSPSQIAGACGVTRATITGLLDGLEHDRLISRSRSLGDRRTRQVRLTAGGRRFLDQMLPGHFRRLALLMEGLDADERAVLRRCAARIAANIPAFNATEPARS